MLAVAIALLTPTNLELQLNGSFEGMHSFDSYRSHSTSDCHNWGTLGEYTPEFCALLRFGWGLLRTINVNAKRQFALLIKNLIYSLASFATLVFFRVTQILHHSQ